MALCQHLGSYDAFLLIGVDSVCGCLHSLLYAFENKKFINLHIEYISCVLYCITNPDLPQLQGNVFLVTFGDA